MTSRNNAETEEYDDDSVRSRHSRGFFHKVIDALTRNSDEEEYEEDDQNEPVAAIPAATRASGGSATPLHRSGSSLRLETVRRTHVTVRRAVQNFEDVRRAVDGLRQGDQQIVNLEQTPADMTERVIDFLNGATYSLDGKVEKIGEQVYLFTPTSVIVDVEDKPSTGSRVAFFDKD